jgi:hypothetical protein
MKGLILPGLKKCSATAEKARSWSNDQAMEKVLRFIPLRLPSFGEVCLLLQRISELQKI